MSCALFATLCLAALAAAQDPDYFPLQVGNQWVYRCTQYCLSADTFTLEVVGTAPTPAPDGSPYFILRGLAKDYWVRTVDGSRVVARDPDGSPEEKLWYDFAAPENQEYSTSVHPCNVTAEIASRKFDYSGPLGHYSALQIKYPATTCNLQGLVEEIFLPSIGLARRVDLVPGDRTYDLIFALVGGAAFTPQSEISFALALDRAVYSIGAPGVVPVITARISLKNTTPDALRLTLPANPYDLEIKNERGEIVYRWSDGKIFPLVLTELDLSPGERSYVVVIPLETDFSQAWPPGTYTAEARLNTTPPDRYTARVAFQIQWIR
jgi:hypothetical protein